jgi:hypothetical protein
MHKSLDFEPDFLNRLMQDKRKHKKFKGRFITNLENDTSIRIKHLENSCRGCKNNKQ